MRSRRRLRAWAVVACFGVPISTGATAPVGIARAEETSPDNVAAARQHFDRARDDYAQGAYREAIGELEAAHVLDPNAKDLVFNLGVVHEKLVDIDDALAWFRLYTTMQLTSQERERADAYIHRLEGAKKELDDKPAAEAARAPPTPQPPPLPSPERPAITARDVLTVVTAIATVGALGVGIVMGVKALADRPPSPFITGQCAGCNGTYADLVVRQDNAHQEAIVADIGLGIAALAGAGTAVLFFTRPRSASRASLSVAPVAGGGAAFVQGSF